MRLNRPDRLVLLKTLTLLEINGLFPTPPSEPSCSPHLHQPALYWNAILDHPMCAAAHLAALSSLSRSTQRAACIPWHITLYPCALMLPALPPSGTDGQPTAPLRRAAPSPNTSPLSSFSLTGHPLPKRFEKKKSEEFMNYSGIVPCQALYLPTSWKAGLLTPQLLRDCRVGHCPRPPSILHTRRWLSRTIPVHHFSGSTANFSS